MLDSDSHSERPVSQKDNSTKSAWHHFGGRKRGQSGQGAELGDIPKREETPRPESQVKQPTPLQQSQVPVQAPAQAAPGAEQEASQQPSVTVNGSS